MNILVLHGPNLNLLGSISAQSKQRLTLDKLNTALRRHVRSLDINIKIYQTHKVFQAINYIQRNRNWADGFLFAPMAWARYEYSILDAIKASNISTIQLLFSNGFDDLDETSSIFSDTCRSTIIGPPDQIYIDGVDAITSLA
ncbi:MAG: type II 3-dehydroquinate dehydratase [Candidatus Marinimicrobia bacterium]|jgi:3-dehydroquinate dehydratase|nr:type II 3-dehydroquinate dehydratase [Candidatus Neomarinimicrobiota bacterium]MDP6032405.1 type II 3-dehydroquinate dehydratase [Candidatus Neomarinimicrobiota bacterium]